MLYFKKIIKKELLIATIVLFISSVNLPAMKNRITKLPSIIIEYMKAGSNKHEFIQIPGYSVSNTFNSRISVYRNDSFQVTVYEIYRGSFTEINGELESLNDASSCGTLKVTIPNSGNNWKWFRGLDRSEIMKLGIIYTDTVNASTVLPPAGAFNGASLTDGGYGEPVGTGTMSFYPLCAVSVDNKGKALGIDVTMPIVYRLSGENKRGLVAEFDVATSPRTLKFPNRAFFRLCQFDFDPEWGMRQALKQYYAIYNEAFKKRVVDEGIWLPFTSLRSIKDWKEFGIAFHETSWGSSDMKDGQKLPNITSDKGTGVMSFQYTEPWDIQLPISNKNIPYDSVVSPASSKRHKYYLGQSATFDKNGLWQTRRLETPWFKTGWAVSITTNCDPDLPGSNRYQYIMEDEIIPALKMNADGIYFDSMEWNWHHDLNYREDHFAYTDYPLTFSRTTGKPAIWNFVSEYEFMKKIADEMHSQGKLAMGNGHAWNPFAAANLDLFGAELSWYASDAHNIDALDFKRAISFQKPIVFLLNEGLNDKAFTEAPYPGYEIYFEKMLSYGFFPSFFSVDASNDPYWKDPVKIENGRPFFKKYIPIIKEIAGAGWEPVTFATADKKELRVERFGDENNLYFTVRNNGKENISGILSLDLQDLGLTEKFKATELIEGLNVTVKENKLYLNVPAGRTRVIKIV